MDISLTHPEVVALVSRRLPDYLVNLREEDGVYRVDVLLRKVPGGGTKVALAAALFGRVTLVLRPAVDAPPAAPTGVRVAMSVESAGVPAGEVLGAVNIVIAEVVANRNLVGTVAASITGGVMTVGADAAAILARELPPFRLAALTYTAEGVQATASLN
ncbi:hypothetical protein GCM10022198_21900 [Klugiella xanthotipulae]|uniref:Uncharacterized protein n=1 Tax=Klugiella xanthotipulae TaxID=244735 RepID=A0A543HY45_9MICO|nr:hypothetical protein [Klugiella xanthotipulae]TQM63274.1 hypothetical protein FB466_1532 [Klugiella xanthotipulae]